LCSIGASLLNYVRAQSPASGQKNHALAHTNSRRQKYHIRPKDGTVLGASAVTNCIFRNLLILQPVHLLSLIAATSALSRIADKSAI
jgi:hypothetical protein